MTTLNRTADVTARYFTQEENTMNTRSNSMTVLTLIVAALLTFVFASTFAHAVPLTASIHDFSTEFTGREAVNIVNGSGIVGGVQSTSTGDMWLSSCCGAPDADPFVTFDLGAVHTVNSFHVWNYNEQSNAETMQRAVQNLVIEYGDTPSLGSTLAGVTTFAIATGGGDTGEDFNTFTPFTAQYIKFDIANAVGDGNYGSAFSFGLSEVLFDGEVFVPPPVPEPSTFALASLGLLGLTRLRRRRR